METRVRVSGDQASAHSSNASLMSRRTAVAVSSFPLASTTTPPETEIE